MHWKSERFLLIVACLAYIGGVQSFSEIGVLNKAARTRRNSETSLQSSIIQILKEKFRPQVPVEVKTDGDVMLELLQEKPWRATKVKNLKVVYRPWKDGWMERYRSEDDDSIYLYTINENKRGWDKTRADEVWHWPWMWTKVKSERLSWIMKVFGEDVDAVTVQEHMEIDNFFSEFDLPVRWGILRIKELDVLNVIALNTVFFTDFNGVRPTDLGLRPDGSVKTCSVQFANCISSSNSPRDTDHYAPPFKWSRSKSPDQAYDEIKEVYMKYPKRGLKWSSGWIDRGGWKPQEFGGPYFHAQAESQAWHYTDDIEMVLDVATREVQYRSSTRIGQRDWDVQRLRYNQFARMLEKKGGWDIQPMERLNWYGRTPYRWSQLMSDKAIDATERIADHVLAAINGLSTGSEDVTGGTRKALQSATESLLPYVAAVKEYLQPVDASINEFIGSTGASAQENEALKKFMEYEKQCENALWQVRQSIRAVAEDFSHSASEMLQLYEDPLPADSPNGALRDSIDKKNSLLKGLFSAPSSSSNFAAPSSSSAMDSGGVSLDATASQALSVSPVGRVGDAIDTAKKTDMSNIASDVSSSPSSSGLNLDQASEISRAPWMQSDSPFVSTASGIPSTSTATSTTMKTSSEINMQRKQKEKAEGSVRSASKKSVSTKDTVENDNDVEWIVDSFNADAPERTEATVTGMSSSGRSVNRRRQQQLQQPQAPVALSTQESRIMKARLDELRKANGLYVSDGSNEAVEQKLIDKFK